MSSSPNRRVRGLLAALLCLATAATLASGQVGDIRRYRTPKSFADVVFELNFAITERNFRITGRNTIGKGLRERGHEDFPNVEVIHFCSLERAREVLEIDPGYVAQMPCRVTVHEAADATVISVILLPTGHPDARVREFARQMNETLMDIAEFAAAGEWQAR